MFLHFIFLLHIPFSSVVLAVFDHSTDFIVTFDDEAVALTRLGVDSRVVVMMVAYNSPYCNWDMYSNNRSSRTDMVGDISRSTYRASADTM